MASHLVLELVIILYYAVSQPGRCPVSVSEGFLSCLSVDRRSLKMS